uniref:uncharacterized protein LOC122610567 n=1 Tax=Erigeron canadensis TaxID=72917 RepID=UPI001CB9B87F|nr:uncharacterized protein LOC122610567 [Erigeron canadensis]
MDKSQSEMQSVGFFGLYKESVKTIFSWKKIFTQITLTFILPLSFICLAHIIVDDILNSRIEHFEDNKNRYYHRRESSEWIRYWTITFVYLTFLFLFSLLSTAAIVYTIASVYTGGDVTFKKVLKAVPTVWKRLAITFLLIYFGFFIYNVVSGVVAAIAIVWAVTTPNPTFGDIVLWILFILFCIGFIYITALWQLASVVTVLESSYGLKAMRKGHDLIKGKRWLSWFVFFVLYCAFAGILILFYAFTSKFTFLTIIVGLVCLFLLMNLLLLGFVAQTMLYLVCKSHHGEPIDKVGLSTQLGGYLGQEPVFKVSKDVEIGYTQSHPHVVGV